MLRFLRANPLPFLFFCVAALNGCEGGKSRGDECGSSPYDNCSSEAKPCPSGQQIIDGVCQIPSSNCPIGSHLENGQCVADSALCEAGEHWENGGCVTDQLSIEIVGEDKCRNEQNGATRVIMQFITRDEAGLALDPIVDANNKPTALESEILVDDAPADVESTINRDSELLKSNLAISLVLDATPSMLDHEPPAFEPMKMAAVNVLQELKNIWAENNADFHWEVTWFDERIFRPAPNNAGEPWRIEDIALIPDPEQGKFTGLWKAVNYGIGVHEELRSDDIAADPRDQHVMVVFSDGDDNHSHFNNEGAAYNGQGNFNNMLFWDYFGYQITDDEDVKNRVKDSKLRIYVIAFGDKLKSAGKKQLEEVALLSGGQYFEGSGSDNLGQLFNKVKREFITMQILGVETSLNPAQEHTFSLRTKHLASGAQGKLDFTLDVNDLEPCNP